METTLPPHPKKKSFTRFFPAIARFVLGLPLIASGLMITLNRLPKPEKPLAPAAQAFSDALVNTGYMMPLIGVTLLVVGLLLVANRFVPLALAFFAPFIVNSLLFHSCLEHTGLPPAIVFAALELYLAWSYRSAYRSMLAARVVPG
jgi:uncharacterized membrane protein YphA (DoxX/SURF4 family)